jgi:DNA adenine methylase
LGAAPQRAIAILKLKIRFSVGNFRRNFWRDRSDCRSLEFFGRVEILGRVEFPDWRSLRLAIAPTVDRRQTKHRMCLRQEEKLLRFTGTDTSTIMPKPSAPFRKLAAVPMYGGKHRMVKHIVPLINDIPHSVYVEPFAGGASVFFALGDRPHIASVLNDKDTRLMTMYLGFKRYPTECLAMLRSLPYSRSVHQQCRAVAPVSDMLTATKDEIIRVAVSHYYCVCNTFGYSPTRGGIKFSQLSSNPYPSTWQNRLAQLDRVLDAIAKVFLEADEALAVIQRWDNPATLFYIDPPYERTCVDHYNATVNIDELIAYLPKIKGRYILSGSAQMTIPNKAYIANDVALRDSLNENPRRDLIVMNRG